VLQSIIIYLSPGDGIGIRVGLRSQILGVRVSSGAPNFMKKALILGCSHAAGAQMSQELPLDFFKNPRDVPAYEGNNSFPVVISRALGYTALNHSISGGSNDAMFRVLVDTIDQLCNQDIVIACWTGLDRTEVWYNDETRWLPMSHGQVNVQSSGPHSVLRQGISLGKQISNPTQYKEYGRQWMLYESTVESRQLNKIKNILALNALAQSCGIRVINIDTFNPIDNFKWPDNIVWPVPETTFCAWCQQAKFTTTDCGHYFKSAHKAFADHVLQFISQGAVP
jgi:hypothetical protein